MGVAGLGFSDDAAFNPATGFGSVHVGQGVQQLAIAELAQVPREGRVEAVMNGVNRRGGLESCMNRSIDEHVYPDQPESAKGGLTDHFQGTCPAVERDMVTSRSPCSLS